MALRLIGADRLIRLISMSRTFKTVDYEAALDLTVRLGDCLPPDHLARFVVDSVALLDLSALYARYGRRGPSPPLRPGAPMPAPHRRVATARR